MLPRRRPGSSETRVANAARCQRPTIKMPNCAPKPSLQWAIMARLMVIAANIRRVEKSRRVNCRTLALLLVALLRLPALEAGTPEHATILRDLPQLWRDDAGRAFNLTQLAGSPVVLTMAYASCHRICPMTIQRLQQLQKDFDTQRIGAEFVIVGYDPEADDAAAWHRYRRTRHLSRANWHFLVGSPQQVAQFAHTLGFEFWKADDHVMHGGRVLYLDAQGVLQVDRGSSALQAYTTE